MSDNSQHQFKDRYMLRLPDGMRDRVKAAAADANRSMNAEIVATLEEKYPEIIKDFDVPAFVRPLALHYKSLDDLNERDKFAKAVNAELASRTQGTTSVTFLILSNGKVAFSVQEVVQPDHLPH